MSIIQTSHLCHRFSDGTLGLDDVTLTFSEGEFTVIAGANGSGKTTFLRHLNGLLFPESGTVTVCGKSVEKDPSAARQMVGLVFQDADSQIVGETVYDDTAFGPENLALDRQQINQRVDQALAAVELRGLENRRPHHLSGGQKRRLAIAGVLAMAPRVMLMDEPFSNLDFPATCRVIRQIIDLHRTGSTIIVTTHDLEKVIAHAQRLVVMANGRVVEDGVPAQVVGGIERYGIRPPCSVKLGRGIQPWVN
ncbi:energy-coupling factor ABC transporter ATP-binding protein [Desulfosarcina sp.]|uniref:energy-coupling factor ABC transporter ATP-binding protein n=1 Tax=Desulfosarcina sp. TaxID=2027861 RepID=UPI00397083E4